MPVWTKAPSSSTRPSQALRSANRCAGKSTCDPVLDILGRRVRQTPRRNFEHNHRRNEHAKATIRDQRGCFPKVRDPTKVWNCIRPSVPTFLGICTQRIMHILTLFMCVHLRRCIQRHVHTHAQTHAYMGANAARTLARTIAQMRILDTWVSLIEGGIVV